MIGKKVAWVAGGIAAVATLIIGSQLALATDANPTGPVAGSIGISGCSPKASQIKLLARPMKGAASYRPDETTATVANTVAPTTTTEPTATTTSTTSSSSSTSVAPTTTNSSIIPRIPTTTTPLLNTTTTTTSPPLTTTTVPRRGTTTIRGAAAAAESIDTELVAAKKQKELKATVDKIDGRYAFAFKDAEPGKAYQIGGHIDNAACDGADWKGPSNGIVIADGKGKLQVPLYVEAKSKLEVYGSNTKLQYLHGTLRDHWQSHDTVDVTAPPATRVFHWSVPVGTPEGADWQVSLMPFGTSCESPSGLVAQGSVKYTKKEDSNSPENTFTVDFGELHQKLYGKTEPATAADPNITNVSLSATLTDLANIGSNVGLQTDGVTNYFDPQKLQQIAFAAAFDGTYHVRVVPKLKGACVPTNDVTISETGGPEAGLTSTVEVNRFNTDIPKNSEGALAPSWGSSDTVDWTSANTGKRMFHWDTQAADVTEGEWQLYSTQLGPQTTCADPVLLLGAGKAPWGGSVDQTTGPTFTVDLSAVKGLEKSQTYEVRVVPKRKDGSCAGTPSSSVHLSYGEQKYVAYENGVTEIQVYAGSVSPDKYVDSNVYYDQWASADSLDWKLPGFDRRTFRWAVKNTTDVVAGKWQLLNNDGTNVPATCAGGEGVLASGDAPFLAGPITTSPTASNFVVDLGSHAAALDTSKPAYVRVLGVRSTGACDVTGPAIPLSYAANDNSIKLPDPPPPAPPKAKVTAQVIGYTPYTEPQSSPPYCYRVVNDFSAVDAVATLKAFEEDPAFLPTIPGTNTVPAGTRLCFTPAAPQQETESFFGTVVGIFNAVSEAYEDVKQSVVEIVGAVINSLGIIDCDKGSPCQVALKAALESGLAAMGIPPSLPNAGQLMDGGVDYLAAQIAEQTGVPPALIDQASDIAKEEIKQALLTVQHPYSGVPEPCPNNACVADDGARPPAVQISVTRELIAPPDMANQDFACVKSSNAALYKSTCAKLPRYLKPGQTVTVPMVLDIDLAKQLQSVKDNPKSQFAPPGVTFEDNWKYQAIGLWKNKTLDTTASFALTPTNGVPQTFVTKESWGTLKVESWG